jgi:signal transduction histidine kinase
VGTKWHLGRQVEAQIRALETAAARAQELADLRARFVVRVSHEFRTPLTVVLAASDALGRYADRMTAEDRAARVAKIQEQVGHMTDLLDDTLMVAQGTADLGRCRPEPTDLAQLCQEVVASVGATANRSAELVTEVALDEPAPSIDPRLTRQILEKILANAVQYGGDQPRVRLEVTSAAGTIRLRVSDLGPGIPARDRARIFEPFYRGSNVGDTDGCGLGLAVVHRAVALQRGTIDVRETPGGGATVEVEIPATVPASDGREGEIAG